MVKTFKGWGENERLQCSEYKKKLVLKLFIGAHMCTVVLSMEMSSKNETVKLVLVGGSGDFEY